LRCGGIGVGEIFAALVVDFAPGKHFEDRFGKLLVMSQGRVKLKLFVCGGVRKLTKCFSFVVLNVEDNNCGALIRRFDDDVVVAA